MIEGLKQIVKKAGDKVMEYYDQDFNDQKKEFTPLTKADLVSDKLIKEGLKQFEGFGVLSEETKEDQSYLKKDKVFVIDPLDGTSDFVHKTGEFAIMLAVLENNYPVLGMIYQPTTKKLYWAKKGEGAFLEENGEVKKLEVSKEDDFNKIKMLVSRHHLGDLEEKLKKDLNIGEFVPAGSAGLKMCRIAEGEAHIYVSQTDKTGEWDSAPGTIIIEEAGGKITDIKGEKLEFKKEIPRNLNGMVVSNGIKHKELVEAIKKSI